MICSLRGRLQRVMGTGHNRRTTNVLGMCEDENWEHDGKPGRYSVREEGERTLSSLPAVAVARVTATAAAAAAKVVGAGAEAATATTKATATTATAATAATVAAHLLELWRNVRLGLAENANELSSLLRVVGREVGVRGTLGTGAASTADAVDVVLAVVGEVVVDDVAVCQRGSFGMRSSNSRNVLDVC